MEKQTYIAPELEVLEIAIEKGFAQTEGGGVFDVPNGGEGDSFWM